MTKNNIEITTSVETSVIDVMADVDFSVDGKDDDHADFADVFQRVIIARCTGQAELGVGRYNIRLLAVVTQNEE